MNRPLSRPFRAALVLSLLLATVVFQSSCLRFPRREHSVSPLTPKDILAVENNGASDLDQVEKLANAQLLAKDFDAIELAADEAREKKIRLTGGYWRIDAIYDGLASQISEYKGQRVNDEMWQNRLDLIELWTKSKPDSITAKIALARAYMEWGWFARGQGYIDTVSEADYVKFRERIREAEFILSNARRNPVCPRWYREMLYIAMVTGWPKDNFEELYERAVKLEPNYLQYHLVKAKHLNPKWNGEPGDWQAFVDALPGRLSVLETDEADLIYFVVVVNQLNEPSLAVNWAMIASERVRDGYQILKKKYGVDNRRLNQFAFISCLTMDLQSARQAFEEIGNARDDSLWSEKTFLSMRSLAVHGIPPPQ